MTTSACFTAGSPGAPETPGGSPEGAEKVLPWAGPVVLSWAGLLGWRELSWQAGSAAERQLCPGAAPLQSAAGLRALPAGTEGQDARKREV